MWNEITYPFPYFNGTTNEVWEWISNLIPFFTENVITYPLLNKISDDIPRELSQFLSEMVDIRTYHTGALPK